MTSNQVQLLLIKLKQLMREANEHAIHAIKPDYYAGQVIAYLNAIELIENNQGR